MINKLLIGLAVLALVIGVAVFRSETVPKHSEVVKIGALMPLTGQISVLGERMRNGMELARRDLIADGVADDVRVVYEDACDTTSSLNAARKLVDVDKVSVIGSSFCLFGEDAIVPYTESKKVILFNTAANPESVLNKKYVFSTNFAIRDDAHNLADYAQNKLHAKTAAIVHLQSSFGESYRANFTQKFEELDGHVLIAEAKLPDATDFRTELMKIKALNPDVLVIVHFGSSLGNALKQARQLGITAPIMGDYESEDPTVLTFAGSAAEGLIISSSQPKDQSVAVQSFEERYKAAYGELPDVLAANAYDALQLQVRSYVACEGKTDCVAIRLSKTKDYEGVSGVITINPADHSTIKSTVFKIVKNGKFEILE